LECPQHIMSEKQSIEAHQIPFTKYPSLVSSTALFGESSGGGGVDTSCNGWVILTTRFLPMLVVVMFGYSFYVYCYLFCYTEIITFHSRRLGVVLMGVFTALTCIVLSIWAAVLLVGPGSVARVEQYDLTQTAGAPGALPVAAAAGPRLSMFVETAADEEEAVCAPPEGPAALPHVFACDSKGFPLWCSHCQSVKPDRVHHSSDLQKCVPRLDHYCAWLGATIGARNYRLFIQFLFYAALDLLFLTITLAIFFHRAYYRTVHSNNVYYIALFALAGTWLLLLLAFASTHLRYIFANRTTLEQIRLNHNQLLMFNFASPAAAAELRVVSRARRGDPGPYDLGGWYANWKDRMGATPLDWLLPFDFRVITQRCCRARPRQRRQRQQHQQREFRAEFNPRLLAIFEQRYASGEEGYLAYPALQTSFSIFDRPGSGVDSSIRPIKSRQSLRNSELH
jgi:palmitoyltransferase